MVASPVNLTPPAVVSLSERVVKRIEELSPVIPLVLSLMWGTMLILLSFALGLAAFQDGPKSLGWIYELNWSSTFAFFVPLSLYFSSSALTSIPQVIITLARGGMLRGDNGEVVSTAELISSWRRKAATTARLAAVLGAAGFVISWIMYFMFCILSLKHPSLIGVHSWQYAPSIAPGVSSPLKVEIFGFLAFTSQGAAIACYVYYILIIFTFAVWIFDYTNFGFGAGIYPDLAETDTRYGFERFEPFIENVLAASIAFFFQFFMTRLFYIYMENKTSSSMFDLIARTMGPGFVDNVVAFFAHGDPSLFDFGSDLHVENAMMCIATLVVVLSALLVPAVIVRQAAWRSKVRLQEAIRNHPGVTKQWYGLDAVEAKGKLETMSFWPIRYAQPTQLLLLVVLATACFFAYKLSLLLIGAVVFKGMKQLISGFKSR
jgi:hypothetical protein